MAGTKHVPCIHQGKPDTRNNFTLSIVADADEILQGIGDILLGI